MNPARRIIVHCLLCAVLAGMMSCAHVVAPSGGPADHTPPKMTVAEPPLGSRNCRPKKIKIKFNEFVLLKDQFTQIVISPPVAKMPEFSYHGKIVVVDFQDSLRANSTYTINFGESVQDITEGNILSGFSYTFSTGQFTDSLTLMGKVINALSNEAEKGSDIYLYRSTSDSLPYKAIPDFVTRSGADGTFEFNNLPPGNYKLFALKDKNANMRYDPFTESIAFSDSLAIPSWVPPADTAKNDSVAKDSSSAVFVRHYQLRMFDETDSIQKLLKATAADYAMVKMFFSQPLMNPEFTLLKKSPGSDWALMEYNKSRDTLTCWIKDPSRDSLHVAISDGPFRDTINMAIKKAPDTTSSGKPGKKPGGKGSVFKLASYLPAGRSIDLNRPLQLEFSHPLSEQNIAAIALSEMIDSTGIPIKATIAFTDPGINRHLTINYAWKPNTTYRLRIMPGVFRDIYGFNNDSIFVDLKSREVEDYGVLKVNLSMGTPQHALFQLLAENGSLIRQSVVEASGKIEWDYMNAGTYKARIIYDDNHNDRWDPGNYLKNIQPEGAVNYSGSIVIKKNWDTEIDWTIK
jgi:uncharacterized protein (DUF2141 family)